MTCIVGLVDNKTIWMGGDSAGSNAWGIETRREPKVWIKDDFIFGYTSSFRMGDILRYKFTPPARGKKSVTEYMATTFVDRVMEVFEENYWMENSGKAEGGTFLVGHKGRLFTVHNDFQVGEVRAKYDSVGSGFHIALGSLFTTKSVELSPKERVEVALKGAAEHAAGVRGPFKILSLGGE